MILMQASWFRLNCPSVFPALPDQGSQRRRRPDQWIEPVAHEVLATCAGRGDVQHGPRLAGNAVSQHGVNADRLARLSREHQDDDLDIVRGNRVDKLSLVWRQAK